MLPERINRFRTNREWKNDFFNVQYIFHKALVSAKVNTDRNQNLLYMVNTAGAFQTLLYYYYRIYPEFLHTSNSLPYMS